MKTLTFRHLLGTSALVLVSATAAHAQSLGTNDGDACADLAQLIEQNDAVAPERLTEVANQGTEENCVVVLQRVSDAGGLDQFSSDDEWAELTAEIDVTKDVRETATVTETVEIERKAIVEGEVAVAVPQPEVDVEQASPEISVTSNAPSVDVQQARPEITIRQPEQVITMQMQAPTITIEQAAPEIIITMPDPSVNVGQMEPKVDVVMADPQIRVTQADPEVAMNLQARIVSPEEAEQMAADSDGDANDIRTTTQSADAEAEPKVNTNVAEAVVNYQDGGEPQVNIARAEAPSVNFESSEPSIRFEQSGEPTVEVVQTGEPKVTFQQANASSDQSMDDTRQADASSDQQMDDTRQADAAPQTDAEQTDGDTAMAAADPTLTTEAEMDAARTDTAMDAESNGEMADEQMADASTDMNADPNQEQVMLTAEQMEGMTIWGVNDERVGDIHSVNTNADGEIVEALLDIGGFLGLGETTVALPYSELDVSQEGDDYRISTAYTKDELKNMPRYQE
ncbi:PRC-barrel domain-containing protein [Pseudooceanicola sp. MF1-13]|uniref:PRC-barrel domain-containing protein n=1 Tax=Pseudooceanicola sp. MF1-13 TaxID=3379095 RepID=UPI0038923AA4